MMSRKRKKQTSKAILEGFTNKVMSEHDDMKFLLNPKGEISMSDAISQLIMPYKEDAPDYNSFSKLVSFACIAWNTSILPQEKQDEAINKMLDVFQATPHLRFDVITLLLELIDRKKRLFLNISRMIVEYKVTDQGNNFHVAVASTMEKKG